MGNFRGDQQFSSRTSINKCWQEVANRDQVDQSFCFSSGHKEHLCGKASERRDGYTRRDQMGRQTARQTGVGSSEGLRFSSFSSFIHPVLGK